MELKAEGHPNLTTNEETLPSAESAIIESRDFLGSNYARIQRMPNSEDRARPLNAIGCSYHILYQNFGETADLEKAVSVHEEAMQSISTLHLRFAEFSRDLGQALNSLFAETGDAADIERAILLCQKAVEVTHDGNPDKPALMHMFGHCLMSRYEQFGKIDDIDRIINVWKKMVDWTPDEYPDKPARLGNLGMAFFVRFDRLGSFVDLEQAIALKRSAVDLSLDEHPHTPDMLDNLGNALKVRFDHLGSPTDLEQAISFKQKAVFLTPDDHPNKPGLLNNLGSDFNTRFNRLGSLADLEQAVSLKQHAVDLLSDEHPHKLALISNLGSVLKMRFDYIGDLADLEKAILLAQTVVDLTPDEHMNKMDRLSSLANALQTRFDRFGNLTDLEQAISLKQNVIDLTPDGHINRPEGISNLGNAFEARFYHLGSLADLEQAILLKQKAVDLSPDGHPRKPGLMCNLGNAFETRFDHLGILTDLEQAISLKQNAVDRTADNHPQKPSLLGNLGTVLLTRFNSLGSVADIEQAILLKQNAVDLTPDEHPNKPGLFSNLGNALRIRAERLGSLADLEQAISSGKNAVSLTPERHPDLPSLLNNLGTGFEMRFKRLKLQADLENAISAFSAAAGSPTGRPMVRFNAAQKWARLLNETSRSPLPAFDCAINLLPRIAWLGLTVRDQHVHLSHVGSVVRDAVTAAIEMDEYHTAVEWAEQGRSIFWQNLLGLRSPLDDLRKVRPELADRLQYISQKLEGSEISRDPIGMVGVVPLKETTQRASQLAAEWDELVENVRKVPSFEYFLKAKAFDKLALAAHEGPVIILNVHENRCDALILISDETIHQDVSVVNIPLTSFSYNMAQELSHTLDKILVSSGVRAREARKSEREGHSALDKDTQFKYILTELWLHVVKPVVDGLAYQIQPDNPPHIWWCVTGPLAFLPIHAAGLYNETGVGDNLFNYLVSSYTPTLTAILDPSQLIAPQDFQLLTVAQPSTPYATPLPGTAEEVRLVKSLTGSLSIQSLTNDEATVERVLWAMERSNWIHLACHGQQNRQESMKSGFLLHDRTLELSEIVKAQLPKPDFAFLSACQTATGDENVAEESMHLAAGMLFSGFRGVVATMWSINDEDAPQVAAEVYKRILEDGKPDRRKAAYALHRAVQQLQKKGANFLSWVPFIHIGR